jgi:hypothetical protein
LKGAVRMTRREDDDESPIFVGWVAVRHGEIENFWRQIPLYVHIDLAWLGFAHSR